MTALSPLVARFSLCSCLAELAFLSLALVPLVTMGASGGEGPSSVGRSVGRIDLVIEGFPDDHGVARIQLARGKADYESGKLTYRQADAAIASGRARCTFEALPPGEYAIKVFHDANANGVLDTNWMKVPKEHYGFSNDPPRRLGPARYEDARFQVEASTRPLVIHLLAPPL